MNVTLITMAYPHPRAGFWPGIERQVRDFAVALREAGATVTVITSFRNGGGSRDEHLGIRILRVPDSVERFGRLGYVMNMHIKTLGANALKLTEVIEQSDVIESFIPLPASASLRRPGLALFAFFPHRDKPSRWSDYLHQGEHFWMEKGFFRRVDAVFVASGESRRVLISEYGVPDRKIEVIPLGVSRSFLMDAPAPAPRQAQDPGSAVRLLYVGLMIPRKGVATLVEALSRLNAEAIPFKAVLAGDGPDRDELRSRSRRLGIDGLVEFPGRVEEEELHALYRGSDIFVFPSVKEGFGLVMVEAMATGLPVVASTVPPMPEIVGEAGLFFRPGDPVELAAHLSRLILDSQLRKSLGEAGKRRVRENFVWDRIAQRTLEVYRRARAA